MTDLLCGNGPTASPDWRRLSNGSCLWHSGDMTMIPRADGGVHLVGSVPLADAETVFRTVAATVGPYLRRIPDGETGERRRWIWVQRAMLGNQPDMELDPTVPLFALRQWDGRVLRETPLLRLRPGLDPEAVIFVTGYAAAAKASYG